MVAVLLGLTAWVLGHQLASPAPRPGVPATGSAAARASGAGAAAVGFVTVRDRQGTFEIGYPSGWRRLHPDDPQVVLLAAGPNGASLLVRKTLLNGTVGVGNLPAAKRIADRVVDSGNGVSLLRSPQRVTLGGLPGYLYLYTFTDPTSGQRGAHAHYFLFDGRTMVTLVFQAMPAPRILSLSHQFDRVAATFHALRG